MYFSINNTVVSSAGSNRTHVTGLHNQDTKEKLQCSRTFYRKKDVIRLQIHSVRRGVTNKIRFF